MEQLNVFIMRCLRICTKATGNKELWMRQAFGAVQFFIEEHPEQFDQAEKKWNELKPLFERAIYGISFDLR